MPIYEYVCPACGTIEIIQKFSDAPLTTCPRCAEKGAQNKVERLISAAAFHLKGSGWYKTDYAKAGGRKESSGEKPGAGEKPASTSSSATSAGSESSAKTADSASDKSAPSAKKAAE